MNDEKVFNFFLDYSILISQAKSKAQNGEGLKILVISKCFKDCQ